jgi:DNA-binding GntR family transcriptional regulator
VGLDSDQEVSDVTQPRRRSGFVSKLTLAHSSPSQEVILAELRRVILDGGAAPGAQIPLDDVAEFFGVSLIPVREALRTLIGEELVDHRQRSGYSVARLTSQECAELYLARGALEVAALRASVAHADDDHDCALTQSQARQRAALVADDVGAYHRESRRFHVALLEPSRMPRLLHMLESAWNITEPVQLMGRLSADDRAALLDDHEQILAAFLARDGEALVASSTLHSDRLRDAVLALPPDSDVFAPAIG